MELDRSDERKTKFLYDIDITSDILKEIKEFVINMVKNTLSKEIEFVQACI